VLKEPVWRPEVAFYFFTGGLGGASSVLSLVARVSGHELLAQRSIQIASAADAVSPPLLIADLGRPERFLNTIGRLPRVADLARTASAVSGAPLAVYTATLISDTAIPVWHEARRELPFLFGSSAVASAGAAAAIAVAPAEAGPARRLAVGGVLVENAIFALMRKRLGMLGEPYASGESGRYRKVSRTCTIGGAALLAGPGRRSRLAAAAGGALVLAGEVAMRWSVFKAGFQSARDPKYTVAPQRARADAARSAPRPPR